MWKITFKYSDESKLKITEKSKEISSRLIKHYYSLYGKNCMEAIYQQYPLKNNKPRNFIEMAQETELINIQEAIYCLSVMADEEFCKECELYLICDDKLQKDMARTAISAIQELQQYRQIGTVEECREARQKQEPKMVIKGEIYSQACPICGYPVKWKFCPNCGQALKFAASKK